MALQCAICQADERLVRNVGEECPPACREYVIAWDDDDEPVDGKGTQLQAASIDRVRKNADLHEVGGDGSRDLDALPFLQIDVDPRMRRHPGAEPLWQKLCECGGVHRKPDCCSKAIGVFTKLAAHPRHLAQDQPGVMRERFSGRRRPHPAATTFEQFDFADHLHVAQTFTCRRQRKPGIRSTMGHAAGIHHGKKQTKVDKIETHAKEVNGKTAFGPTEV